MPYTDSGHLPANRELKSTMFCDLFGSPERRAYTLSLYNALRGPGVADPAEVEVNTLENVLFMGRANDVSLLVRGDQELWEHQSTPNPNMPLRGLLYFARLYERTLELPRDRGRIYTSSLVRVPTPRYVVFYMGERTRPERELMRLSDAYEGEGALEVVAEVLNVNPGFNEQLKASCPELAGYSEFVRRVRANCETMGPDEAVAAAVRSCIADGILAEYLTERGAEVISMFMTDWDEEAYREMLREDALEQGMQQGMQQGMDALTSSLADLGVDRELLERALADARARTSPVTSAQLPPR